MNSEYIYAQVLARKATSSNFTRNNYMEPFLKWPGGKRWLITKASDLLPEKSEFSKYFEPFLGGGAIYFHLEPDNGLLSDINLDLINSYQVIRDNWANLIEILLKYNRYHCNEFYYKMRSTKPRDSLHSAARFLYLNRTCWNGLYRVNKKGDFNVPIGTKNKVILESDNFSKLSKLLSQIDIEACDFETTIDKANEGDFVFIDPPYTVKHNLNGFVKYNEHIFSWEDQIRLRNSIIRAVHRRASILMLNANHDSIRALYSGIGQFISLERASVISGNADARGLYSELAIKC